MCALPRSVRLVAWFTALVVLVAAIGCNGGNGAGPNAAVSLHGAGASFPNPLYQKWVSEYGKVHENMRIDYQSIGSGGGIKQLKEQTVDFGASDAPLKDEDVKSFPGEVVHIPTVLGAVVITYNLPGLNQPLKFSSDVVADI